jgi:hypothetical protein
MSQTVAIRMLRDFSVYKAGQIIPAVNRGQADVWIRRKMAEPVDTPPAPPRSADMPETVPSGRRSSFSQGSIKRRG